MNKMFMNFLFICMFFVASNGTAQEAVLLDYKDMVFWFVADKVEFIDGRV